MQPVKKHYFWILASLLLIAVIMVSPYQNWLSIRQASAFGIHKIFFPIIGHDNTILLGQATRSPQAMLVPTSTLTPTPTTVPTPTLVPYNLLQQIDVGPFVFHASDDMVEIDVQGIDSLVKLYRNDQMEISIDYGWFSGYAPHSSEITLTIDGFEAIYHTKAGYPNSGYKYSSIIFFEDFDLADPQNLLGMYIGSNREDAAEVALAVFKTIDFPYEAGVYPLNQEIDVGPLTFRVLENTREIIEARESDPIVRKYDRYETEITLKYGDSLNYSPDDTEETITIDGFEALYYTREADSDSRYDAYSTIYFEKTSTSDSSESLIMEIDSYREDAAALALAIFNTIQFTSTATPVPTPEAIATTLSITVTPSPISTPTPSIANAR